MRDEFVDRREAHEDIDNHRDCRAYAEERINEVVAECYQEPVESSDDDQNPSGQVYIFHIGGEIG